METNGPTDGQTDGGDCITFLANAVGNNTIHIVYGVVCYYKQECEACSKDGPQAESNGTQFNQVDQQRRRRQGALETSQQRHNRDTSVTLSHGQSHSRCKKDTHNISENVVMATTVASPLD